MRKHTISRETVFGTGEEGDNVIVGINMNIQILIYIYLLYRCTLNRNRESYFRKPLARNEERLAFHKHTRTHIDTHTYTHTHAHAHTHMYTSINEYIYIYITQTHRLARDCFWRGRETTRYRRRSGTSVFIDLFKGAPLRLPKATLGSVPCACVLVSPLHINRLCMIASTPPPST